MLKLENRKINLCLRKIRKSSIYFSNTFYISHEFFLYKLIQGDGNISQNWKFWVFLHCIINISLLMLSHCFWWVFPFNSVLGQFKVQIQFPAIHSNTALPSCLRSSTPSPAIHFHVYNLSIIWKFSTRVERTYYTNLQKEKIIFLCHRHFVWWCWYM